MKIVYFLILIFFNINIKRNLPTANHALHAKFRATKKIHPKNIYYKNLKNKILIKSILT